MTAMPTFHEVTRDTEQYESANLAIDIKSKTGDLGCRGRG
jgi:hypothetical protein